ncbi:MAG: hypothetical protein HDS68_07665 [Bacteroidales bacterium]|nr:hypothetical protein [Bacteroidales bacterium]
MKITKINIDGKEYIIKDKEAQIAVEELRSKLEAVEQELKSVSKLHIIEVE